jgi:hypothetical protein
MEECYKRAVSLGLALAQTKPDTAINRAECYAGLVRVMELLNNSSKALPKDVEIHPVG